MNTVSTNTSLPKAPLYILGLCGLIALLFIARDFLIPLTFAGLFSIMLSSVVNRLISRGLSRMLAVVLTVIPAILILMAFSIIFFSQLSNFVDTIPILIEKVKVLTTQFVNWGAGFFNMSPRGFETWLSDLEKDLLNKSGVVIGYTISTMSNTLVSIFLIPVYVFMMLYYQPIIVGFLHDVFGKQHRSELNEILPVTKDIIKNYLIGLIIETAIVATLNSIGLFILGIEYAILLGLMGGLLNVIPYLGAIVTALLYMIVALVTKDHPSYALFVLINYLIIQFIDNNFLVPKIIGSKVKLNAFVSIVAVIAGGALWGIPGMFLSIPLLALIKVICDRVEQWQPWGFLLGDSMPSSGSKYFKRFKIRRKPHGPI
jgi:predicted PurR-regulated permease PerM